MPVSTTPHYPKDTAGHILTPRVPMVREHATASEVRSLLEARALDFDTINYVYVVDTESVLKGVVSLREVLQAPATTAVLSLSPELLVSVRPHTDQERVAYLALRGNLKAVPVVDARHVLLGVVTWTTILSILQHEHTEDFLHLAGIQKQHDPHHYLVSGGVRMHIISRLPWLIIGIAGGMLAAVVVHWFEAALRVQLMLAAFIPLVVYIADAVSAQTQMLYIRAVTVVAHLDMRAYVFREMLVNMSLGSILAMLVYAVSWWWLLLPLVSATLTLTVFLTVCSVTVVGIGIPWYFYRRGYDPAVSSEPITSVVCQLVSLFVYFTVALLFL